MQACIENATLPLLEPTSLPLLEPTSPPLERTRMPLRESASLPRIDNVPTWTIRVARPPAAHRNELAQELRGVPKAALRHVFGKIMGTHLWQLNRAIATAAPANSSAASANAKPAPVAPISPVAAISPSAPISDCEISSGLLRYLCAEAAATLRDRKRVAKSIALTVQFSGGESATVRQSLPQPASDPAALEAATRLALRRMRSNAFVSLTLDVTAAMAPCAATKATDSATAHASLTAVA
jgi:hypothetical protein